MSHAPALSSSPPSVSVNKLFFDQDNNTNNNGFNNGKKSSGQLPLLHSSSLELIIQSNKVGDMNNNSYNDINDTTPQNAETTTTTTHTIRNFAMLFVFPLVCCLGWMMIPLQPPQPGFINNWVFCVIAAPILPLFSVPATALINSVMLDEPPRHVSSAVAGGIFLVGWSLWVEFAPFPYPALPNMIISTIGLSSMIVTPYIYSKKRFTPAFNKFFKDIVLSYNNINNAFFMTCLAYCVGMLLVPNHNFQILLTAALIPISWILSQKNSQVGVLAAGQLAGN